MANEGAQSAFSQFAIGGYKMCFEHIDPLDNAKLKDHSDSMNCGTRARSAADQSKSITILGATVYLQPTPEELAVLLPLIGFTLNTTYGWTDALLPKFVMKTERRVSSGSSVKVRSYSDCSVDSAQFWSTKGQPLNLALRIFAMGYADGGSFTESEVSNNSTPFMHNEGECEIDGEARKFTNFRYSINNRLTIEHNNSVLPTNIDAGDRIETVGLNVPANLEHEDLIDSQWTQADQVAGYAAWAKYTRGGKSVLFTYDVLKGDAGMPPFPIRGNEIRYGHNFRVYKDDATSSTIVTLDTTA